MAPKAVLPLPDGFFRVPPLADVNRHQYIRQGQKTLLEFVEKARLRGGPINWTFDYEANGVMVYRGLDFSLPAGHQTVFLNVMEVHGTLDEAADIMNAGPDGTRDYCATYNNDEVLDMKTLYPIAHATPEHPHNSIAIKWRSFTTNNPLVALRDMIYLEYNDDFTIDNVQGFGRIMTSVDLDGAVPDLYKSLGIVRIHMFVCGDLFLKSERREGYMTAFRIYSQDIKGSLPPWIVSKISRRLVAKCMSSLDNNLRHERVIALEAANALLPECAMIPKESRTHCTICTQGFTAVIRKSNCYKCGEVVYHGCNKKWSIEVGPASAATELSGASSVFALCVHPTSPFAKLCNLAIRAKLRARREPQARIHGGPKPPTSSPHAPFTMISTQL
ncbi:hypothetical protein AeMF1_003053 [Aphanomyces euteiches]|nr:hypothetical protein AeMF1_003053 [Aphanomyces euteiches]KAH9187206.1 hypothetical protein AeNC1_010821 [Aphanomyces euteiches]